MRPFDTLIRLSEQELDGKRKLLAELEGTLAEAQQRRQALDVELKAEQEWAAESVDAGFGYGTYAQQMIRRRNLADTAIAEAEAEVEAAREEVRLAFAELKRYQITHDARLAAQEAQRARKDQATLDETAQNLARRKADRL